MSVSEVREPWPMLLSPPPTPTRTSTRHTRCILQPGGSANSQPDTRLNAHSCPRTQTALSFGPDGDLLFLDSRGVCSWMAAVNSVAILSDAVWGQRC